MQKSKGKKTQKIRLVTARTMGKKKPIYSDVSGSYTGRPMDGEKPIQDADDL